MLPRLSLSWLRVVRKPTFWLIIVLLAFITVFHYREVVPILPFLADLTAQLGLSRHTFERILYMAVIIWAGFLFDWKGSITVSVVVLACMLPRALIISTTPRDAILETAAVFIVGNLVAFGFEALRKEREHRIHLEVLNRISSVVSQSLELGQILNASVDITKDVMNVDASLIFLLDGEAGDLILEAHQGISEAFAQSVGRLRLGEGFNGKVAQTGESMYVEDASKDLALTQTAVKEENIQSQLIVPLRSKGKVMGTICVAVHQHRQFRSDEIRLLTAIGNQIGIAVENARLYEQARKVIEQLQASEERYRELFESAHDAIWVHDMDGNIVTANKAAARLVGYGVDRLCHMNVRVFLTKEGFQLAEEIRAKLLHGEYIAQPYEQRLLTRQGSEAILKLTTNVVRVDAKPVGFQHIARDITREKRMQENLRFYLRQITIAQEEERKRIARELHDETIQALVILARTLDEITSAGKQLPGDKKHLFGDLRQQINTIMQDVRRLSQDLRPPALDRLGLTPALEGLAADIEKLSGINVEVRIRGISCRLPAEIELVLFRIVQEALRNIWRHSQATRAEIEVEFNERKNTITIKDNGKGFDLPEMVNDLVKYGKLGLAGMQERIQLIGGNLRMESQIGKGTTVVIETPIQPVQKSNT